MIPLLNIMLGEVIVGGVGAGFYGIAVFIVATLFIAGLMVGRSPEYLGKKIEASEAKLATLAILVSPIAMLVGTAIALAIERASGRERECLYMSISVVAVTLKKKK